MTDRFNTPREDEAHSHSTLDAADKAMWPEHYADTPTGRTVREARLNITHRTTVPDGRYWLATDNELDALIAAARAEERAKAELNYEKGYAAGKLYAHAYVMIRTRAATLAEVREKVRAMDGVVAEVGDDNLLCVTQAHGFPTWLVRRTDVLAVLAALEEGK